MSAISEMRDDGALVQAFEPHAARVRSMPKPISTGVRERLVFTLLYHRTRTVLRAPHVDRGGD
ncbi:MAG: hypothetical protein ACREJ3_16250 [Polyangiaceae bacterium]